MKLITPRNTNLGPSTLRNKLIMDEDWATGALAGSYGWTATTSTGTVIINSANVDGTHWGLVALTSGTANANAALISTGAANRVQFGSANVYWEAKINLSRLSDGTSDYHFRAGFFDNWAGAANNGVYFDYTSTASANWRMGTANGGSRTTTATSTPVATGDLNIAIRATTTGAEFFVNDVSIGTQSANFPTNPMFIGIGIQKTATGSTNTTVLIDRVSTYATWATPR